MVLEFNDNVEGITVSIDTDRGQECGDDPPQHFASAGIDFDVPLGHQLEHLSTG